MWNVRPGDKVVLVTEWSEHVRQLYKETIFPVLKTPYTVRNVTSVWNGREHTPALQLVEIVNTLGEYQVGPGKMDVVEISFQTSYFRPLITHKGMETLRSLLNNPKLIKEVNPLDTRKVKVE